jgi:DNA invertase Pin-like site-specific DNA recombinase
MVGYIRVSTELQEREGASLDAQEAALRDYAARHELVIVELIRDQVSGTKESLERPELQRALAMLEDGDADGVLVWHLDRFSRNLRDASALLEDYFGEKTPWRLASVTEDIDTRTPSGRLHLHLMLSVHQYEAERIAERIRAVRRFLAAQGVYCGGRVPYGYVVGPRRPNVRGRLLEPNKSEQAVIAQAVELNDGQRSLRAIARELDRRGIRARSGKPFHPEQIARLVREREEAACPSPT